jgi:hypothetical protein
MEENFLLLFRFDNPLDSSVEFMKVISDTYIKKRRLPPPPSPSLPGKQLGTHGMSETRAQPS